jgi:Family of unknown function (DUF6599)
MRLFFLLAFPVFASAAIWPDSIGAWRRTGTTVPKVSDQALWDEYGLKESEAATFENGNRKFTAIGYRLGDTTGAMAAFNWQRPADAKPHPLAELSAQTARELMLVRGNYLLTFQGYKPPSEELAPLLDGLRNVDATPLPTLPGFLPSQNLVPNSQRYVVGPVGLAKFEKGIPPSVAAFHLGAEAQIGTFRTQKGDMTLAIFDFPTPQIARQKQADFEGLPGAVVKRSGPLVAVILAPPDPDAAERLLAQVRYEAQITLSEGVGGSGNYEYHTLLNIVIFGGILIVFCVIAGLFVGGFRVFLLGRRKGADADPMILLHLEQR